MPVYKLFGRVTTNEDNVRTILEYFDEVQLACMEGPDSGVTADHCHFIATKDAKNIRTLRENFSYRCKKIIGSANQYQLKEYQADKTGAEEYLCKGDKNDASKKPKIIINNINIDIDEYHRRFHQVASDIKTSKSPPVWKKVIEYIEKVDPAIFNSRCTRATQVLIAGHMWDFYIKENRMIQGKFFQQMVLQTILAHKFNDSDMKRRVVEEWCQDITYWTGMNEVYYEHVEDALRSF